MKSVVLRSFLLASLALAILFLGGERPGKGGEEAYSVRYDSPGMICSFGGAGKSRCRGDNIYPATPSWVVSQGDEIVVEKEADVVYFPFPWETWLEVTMEVVRWDGEIITLSLAIVHDRVLFYRIPLNAQTVVQPKYPEQDSPLWDLPNAPPKWLGADPQ